MFKFETKTITYVTKITKFYPSTYHHTRCISCYKLRKGKNASGTKNHELRIKMGLISKDGLPHHWIKNQCERCHYLGMRTPQTYVKEEY